METNKPLLKTYIPDKEPLAYGKVRDNYNIPGWWRTKGRSLILMITTDRLSAFDVVIGGVPDLGKVRNQISLLWFGKLEVICPNHIFSTDQELCSKTIKAKHRQQNDLIGRSVLVRQAQRIPVECVVRGYLDGSAWEVYKTGEPICGIKLPSGLKRAEELLAPIFTPTTKAEVGHDESITFDELVEMVGGDVAEELRYKSIKTYQAAHHLADTRGIIIADTKFEFGFIDGKLTLIDELLTPDSSRFWDKAAYRPGGPQPSFDKQPVRDWLTASGWNKKPPAPALPNSVIEDTAARYREAYKKFSGKPWPPKF